ncbi:hypothetical protein [Bartonella sp. B30(2025)]
MALGKTTIFAIREHALMEPITNVMGTINRERENHEQNHCNNFASWHRNFRLLDAKKTIA